MPGIPFCGERKNVTLYDYSASLCTIAAKKANNINEKRQQNERKLQRNNCEQRRLERELIWFSCQCTSTPPLWRAINLLNWKENNSK
jgi:hypothetical protein